MDEHPDEIGAEAVVTLVRRAGEPISPDLRRRIRSNIEGHLAGDLIVDTFDDVDAEHESSPTSGPSRRSRWLLGTAAAVVATVGVGTIVAINDRGDTPPATSPATPLATRPLPTPDLAPDPVVVSTASPTGELAVRRIAALDEPGGVALSEFLSDGRLLRWYPTERNEVVTLYSRRAEVDVSTVLPKGVAAAGAGDRTLRDVAVGPDDVLYASYLTSVTPRGWHFNLVAYSFEQQPRELGRWPAYRACSAHCGELELVRDGIVIDDAGDVVPYVDPVTGASSGAQQSYIPEEVQATYDPTRESGVSGLDARVSYGDETWMVRIEGIPALTPSTYRPILELQPQRDGSLLGLVPGDGDSAANPYYLLWLRPGGHVDLYGLAEHVDPREVYSLGGASFLAVGRNIAGLRFELLVLEPA